MLPINLSANLPTYELARFPPPHLTSLMDNVSVWTIQEVAKATHRFWTVVGILPQEIEVQDRLYYHTTTRYQTAAENAWTGLMYGVTIFISLIAADFLITRPVTWLMLTACGKRNTTNVKKCSWLLLHSLFNAFIMIVSWTEAWVSFLYPTTHMIEPPRWYGVHPGALLGTIAIGAFHMHHVIFFNLTLDDVRHHLGTALVVTVGVCCPWNKSLSLANMAMCAIPGGLNYLNMWLRKMDIVSTSTQKFINRWLNIAMRYPLTLCSLYHFIINVSEQRAPDIDQVTFMFMCMCMFTQYINTLYYADQVVGNFWIYRQRSTVGEPHQHKVNEKKKSE